MAKKTATAEATPDKAPAVRKTVCPVTLEEFKRNAKPVTITVNGIPMIAEVKAPFSTGSLGWYLNGKTVIEVNGKPVSVQIGFNLTCVGSKPDA